MFKKVALFLLVLSFQCLNAQIKLTQNTGEILVKTDMTSCERDESWSRVFKLSDFGISRSEQFKITTGEVGISYSDNGAIVGIGIFSVDADFPNSKPIYLGGGANQLLPKIDGTPQIVQFDLSVPVIVPAGVERILVQVSKREDSYNPNSAEVLIAGTAEDTGGSWYKGCRKYYTHTATTDLDTPVSNANFYINVTGEKINTSVLGSTTMLSHNKCGEIVKTGIHSCSSSYIYWGRTFTLKKFGITTNEEFVINSGQVAVDNTGWVPTIQFNIYKIDVNFPSSFSENDLIGSSQQISIPTNIAHDPRIISIDFDNPVVVPADVEMILVEVFKGIEYGSGIAFISGGSAPDADISWQRGCIFSHGENPDTYYNMKDIKPDVNANFYINVVGNVKNISTPFSMNITNNCSDFYKGFSITNDVSISSVIWDFGDPLTGNTNQSTELNPVHDFSSNGEYTITATIKDNVGGTTIIQETIDVLEPPYVYEIQDVYACEDNTETGISSSFDTSAMHNQIVDGRSNILVSYFNGKGQELPSPLPNTISNSIPDNETITVVLSYEDRPCCTSETTFDLIVNPLPDINAVEDLIYCDDDFDGFATFDLTPLEIALLGNSSNLEVNFTRQNGNQIINVDTVKNVVENEETITVSVLNIDTNCNIETTFNLIVDPLPIANSLDDLIGCDDNNDGISEYFDTSSIGSVVLGSQTSMEISYFDNSGDQLPFPLPNPYTNTTVNQESITVRVANPQTGCYSETILNLKTSTKPQINQLQPIYACDEGNGYATFDLSDIPNQLIGNQTGLKIILIDEEGSAIPFPNSYQNTKPWEHLFVIRVEDKNNPMCYSETNLELIVNQLPQIDLESEYFLCDLEPSLYISTDSSLDSWEWTYENGTILSNSYEANLIDNGTYTLTVGKLENGILCTNSSSFKFIRSVLPAIEEVKFKDLSDANFIEIMASGDGDFEYSLDGESYQDSNLFSNIQGGIYTAFVRDKKGCGEDFKEVVLVDFPKFLTPNNDGVNDYWQIQGVKNYPNALISIYDRFGKILKQLNANDMGWDGYFNGVQMPSTDYWFTVDLQNGRTFKGHFTMVRR